MTDETKPHVTKQLRIALGLSDDLSLARVIEIAIERLDAPTMSAVDRETMLDAALALASHGYNGGPLVAKLRALAMMPVAPCKGATGQDVARLMLSDLQSELGLGGGETWQACLAELRALVSGTANG